MAEIHREAEWDEWWAFIDALYGREFWNQKREELNKVISRKDI